MPGEKNYLIGRRWLSTQEVRAEIVHVLPRLPRGHTIDRLNDHFASAELSPNTINKMLLALTRQGKLARVKRGAYIVKPKDAQ